MKEGEELHVRPEEYALDTGSAGKPKDSEGFIMLGVQKVAGMLQYSEKV